MKKFWLSIFLIFNSYIFSKPIVFVSILPQAEFVERIAGDRLKVNVLIGKGANPHNYEPTPRQVFELGKAKIWFTIGIEAERGLIPKISSINKSLKIVYLTNGIKYRLIEEHEHEDEEENHEEERPFDPHIWLGYKEVKIILSNTLSILTKEFPEDKGFFEKNYEGYIREIDNTFGELASKLKGLKGKTIIVYHPAFGYFFDNFGIIQKPVEIKGKEPTQKDIVNLINFARKENIKVIFVQKQFSKNAAKTIAKAINGRVIEIDPLEKEWLKNAKKMGELIAGALE